MTIGALIAVALVCVALVVQAVRRARRRRWRAERKERHRRIARDWVVLRSAFGPRNKRLTYDSAEGEQVVD